MDTEHEEVPAFNDAQKKYFQEQLSKQSGKTLNLSPELLTNEQRAQQAHESRDFSALQDLKVRSEFLRMFGVDAFGRLHLAHTRAERERKAAEDQQLKLAEARKRNGRH